MEEVKKPGTERFFIDQRAGCIAVRDREHPYYNPEYQGLHNDTPDVIFYAHGYRTEDGWAVSDHYVKKANEVLWHLQSLITKATT